MIKDLGKYLDKVTGKKVLAHRLEENEEYTTIPATIQEVANVIKDCESGLWTAEVFKQRFVKQ